jgi:hypothetical protein
MQKDEFLRIASTLGIDEGKQVESEDAIATHNSNQALAYSQPGAKFAGLLFYTDQTENIAEPSENLIEPNTAKDWSNDFMQKHEFAPRPTDDQKIKLSFDMFAYESEGLVFDGKQRKKIKSATEVASKIMLNDIPVIGPRAKVRFAFKSKKVPINIHCAVWQNMEVFEQREFLSPHDVYTVIKEKLSKRKNDKRSFDVINQKIAYFAQEYNGGPDILAPYYFVDVEYSDPNAEKIGEI